jgi:adenylate cyclase
LDSAREYAFAGFTLNLQRGVLRDGSGAVDLRPKAFHLLACLITNAGRVMPKEELLDTIWPDVTVSEDSLTQCIGELRRALGQAASAIRTVPRRGYVFEEAALEAVPAAIIAESPAAVANERPSIAVMPFRNLSSDPEQEFFTDGLTEDIITDLSNVPGFFVIASNSTFAYKGKPTDVRQIAEVLGVKYILEGSARRSAQRLRINAQLINGPEGGTHIWAERFDRDLADIFVVQDEIARRVVEAITGKLAAFPVIERYRPSNLEAYDLCVRARSLLTIDKALNRERQILVERAVALDPGYCEAHWRLAVALRHNWLHWGEPQESNRKESMAHAQRAVDLDPNDSGAHWALGNILSYDRRWDEAELHFQTSIRLNPNDANALTNFSDFKTLVGEPQQAVQLAERALRLNPHPPSWYYWNLGFAQVANGRHDDAVLTLRREETYRTISRRILAAALALCGRASEAQMEAKLFLAASPHWRIGEWIENQPFKNPKDAQLWIDAYRLAGLPE